MGLELVYSAPRDEEPFTLLKKPEWRVEFYRGRLEWSTFRAEWSRDEDTLPLEAYLQGFAPVLGAVNSALGKPWARPQFVGDGIAAIWRGRRWRDEMLEGILSCFGYDEHIGRHVSIHGSIDSLGRDGTMLFERGSLSLKNDSYWLPRRKSENAIVRGLIEAEGRGELLIPSSSRDALSRYGRAYPDAERSIKLVG